MDEPYRGVSFDGIRMPAKYLNPESWKTVSRIIFFKLTEYSIVLLSSAVSWYSVVPGTTSGITNRII